jgi:PBP1b-binding outer membrane lipoprotein LpoB
MKRIVLIMIMTALLCGCATAKSNDYCKHDEVMVIEVQNDNFIVKCYNPAVELDRSKTK